jgi:heme-degrading monooxygenase HmoA
MAIVRVGVTDGDPAELEERYRRVQERLRSDGGDFPFPGLKVHTAMKTPSGLRVANIWESEEQADAAWPRIQQALRDEGGSPEEMTIEQYEVINLITT